MHLYTVFYNADKIHTIYFGNYFIISHKMLAEMHDLPTFSLGNTSVNLTMTSREWVGDSYHCRLCFEFMAGWGVKN